MNNLVIFVGDKPSSKNTDIEVAFVGTQSHKVLLNWIEELNVKNFILINSDSPEDKRKIMRHLALSKAKWVSLGNNAASILNDFNVNHFKLPHPSPKNRKLNDENFIKNELLICKKYLENKNMTVVELAEILNYQAETREELDERNLEVLYKQYEKMFKEHCGQVPVFKIIDKKGKVYIYGYFMHN